MDVKFAHEFTAFKAALPPSYCVTRIVITTDGLKAKYSSAFNQEITWYRNEFFQEVKNPPTDTTNKMYQLSPLTAFQLWAPEGSQLSM
eukprot:scaffold6407_cov78-Cyclotella_meneghiniana.AAC.2